MLFIIVLMTTTIIYFNVSQDYKARQREIELLMLDIAEAVASQGSVNESRDWQNYQDYIDNILYAINDIVYIAIIDADGNIPAYTLNEDIIPIPLEVSSIDSVMKSTVRQLIDGTYVKPEGLDSGEVQARISALDDLVGDVHLGYSRGNINAEIDQVRKRNLIVGGIFVLIGLFASLFVSDKLTNPLMRLSAAMETVPHGSQDMVIKINSRDEIGGLADSFNYMVSALREGEFFDKFERDLSAVFTIDKIFSILLGRLGYLYSITKGAIVIKKKKTGEFDTEHQVAYSLDFSSDFHILLQRSLDRHLKRNEICFSLEGLKIIAREVPELRPLIPVFEKNRIHWVIFLQRKETCLGVIYLGKDSDDFTVNIEEKKYIVNLVRHIILPIENALLYTGLAEQERLEKELEIARTVQRNLLPQQKPEVPGYDVFGVCQPAKEVGGDYFDYVQIDDDRLGVVIADVAGKGTSASFYMAEIKGMILSLSELYNSPAKLLKVVNKCLFLNIDRRVFVTMIYGIIDRKTGEFTYARAGHNPILVKLCKKNVVETRAPKGIGLGLESGKIFDGVIVEDCISIKNGDAVLLYTDGVIEAMNKNRDEFGEVRLINLFASQNGLTAEKSCREILKEIKTFTKGSEQFDDIAMVMIKSED